MKHIYSIFFILMILSASTPFVSAATAPSFPSCTNPSGTIKVQYASGIHGIVGRTAEYRGSDTVYTLDENKLLQCFCAEDKSTGIQSNWWKANSLSQADFLYFKNLGWYYVPNGSLWGLSGDPYLVYNIDYSCGGTGGGIVSSFSSTNNSGGGNGSVNNVFGLPATGGEALYGAIALLIISFFYYFSFNRKV